ncbi:MAG: HAMP domain-containing protein, partial [Rhodobacteraceae bacterium]|nr:HAMP domain-containing protein [Paracoccaceae bacterium]
QAQIQRGLKEAYVIDGTSAIRARGERSYLFDYEPPSNAELDAARRQRVLVIEDWDANEFRALVALDGFVDRYLLVSRAVDGELLNLLDDTEQTAQLYQQLERDRGRMLFEFSLLYLGFAVMLVLAAIWLGLWFAERLAGPVGRLAGAAQRVGDGDLTVHVREEKGDDEIAVLGRVFNQMTRQLGRQRQTLLDANAQIETRRRLFDSVLSSVSAGVMGLDADGRVDFINRSGRRLLFLEETKVGGRSMAELVPEFLPLLDRLRHGHEDSAQQEIKLRRGGAQDILLVRMGMRQANSGAIEGFVVAFDDVTDLVSAQRMAAWGDVARRIAHEIKNPLTPIQLSAERIKRKFAPQLTEENTEKLEQLTDVIVRQTGDLRRIVDEFSKFARMPEPVPEPEDLSKLVSEAVLLQATGNPHAKISEHLPDVPARADLDATLISRALVNLLKNAVEAAETIANRPEGQGPEVRVTLGVLPRSLKLTIDDNGPGFPPDRAKLFEPYVTNREGGTGLGLSIVKKIIEDHGGRIRLEEAPPFAPGASSGARVLVILPRLDAEMPDAAE